MGKRGPKPSSPNGEPKKRVTMALASDVREWIYSHKPTVPWLESLMRDAMRAEGFRNFGDALPKYGDIRLRSEMDRCSREFLSEAKEKLLSEWVTQKHGSHQSLIVRYGYEVHPGVSRYVCGNDGEALTLTERAEMRGTILHLSVEPLVSQILHCSCGSAAIHMNAHDATCAHAPACPDCAGTGWLRGSPALLPLTLPRQVR